MKKTFTSLLMVFAASVALNAQTYFSNNFDGENPAPGWVQFNNGVGLNQNWALYTTYHSAPYAAGVQYEAVASGLLAEDYFATPLIDLTEATSPRLSFMALQGYEQDYGSTYHVLVSTTEQNSIDAYTEIASWDETTLGGGVDWEMKLVDLSDYAGQQIYIAFMMSNNDGDYFLIDDVVVEESLENNATLLDAPVTRYLEMNQDVYLDFVVRNSGSNPITSLELTWNDGTEHSTVINDLNIGTAETATITHPDVLNYSTVGQQSIVASVTQVNGGADSNPEDNTLSATVNVISQDGGKKVVFEEGTGTWCGWCPRGMVAMEYMQETYPDSFIGIAVHNGDPMAFAAYNSGANFSGFPQMNVDRKAMRTDVSQETMVNYINTFTTPTPIGISGEASVNGREVTFDVTSTFYSNFSDANFRMGVIVVEDGVTGTTAGYRQANYYAGGAAGPMGGYENMANPVPADQMVYDHVGRALLGGYNGQEGSVPSTLTDGQSVSYTFNYTVPSAYNMDNMHGVAVIIDQNTGEIVNANIIPINTLGVNDAVVDANAFAVYPTPASSHVNLNLAEAGKYKVTIYNTAGQEVLSHKVNASASRSNVSLPVNQLKPGVYIITASTDGKSYSKKLIIK